MTALHDALEELAQDAPRPEHLLRDLVGDARAGARRRRTRRRWAVAAVVAVVAVVAGLVLTRLPPPPDPVTRPAEEAVVSSYPERLSYPARPPYLPSRPGPLAAVMNVQVPTEEETSVVDAVSPDGTTWTLDTGGPVLLSPDGRLLAYVDSFDRRLRVHDLVSGSTTAYLAIGSFAVDQRDPPQHPLTLDQAHWSPDSRHVFLREVSYQPTRSRAVVLDLRDGSTTQVPVAGQPAGFMSADRVVTVEQTNGSNRGLEALIHVYDRSTGRGQQLQLQPRTPFSLCYLTRFSLSVSPDGSTLLVGTGAALRLFDLSTGVERLRLEVRGLGPFCPVAWREGRPVVSVSQTGSQLRVLRVSEAGAHRVMALNPSSPVANCVTWAADAIDGSTNDRFLGTWPWWWTFHWQAILAALALLLLVVVPALPWWHRPSRRQWRRAA